MGSLSRALLGAILAALALLSVASAGVNTPHSGWYSGNPLLGPNTLTDLACSGSTCYASGQFGTLLKSTDAGATWSGIVTGLTLDLAHVRLAGGAPDHVLVGGGCSVRRSDDGGDTFFRLPFTARDARCPVGVTSFSFPTDRVGYLLLADGRVLATADGGRTFSRRTPVPGGANDILCTAERTCFTAGSAGSVQRTSDGGVSWVQAGTAAPFALAGLERVGSTMYAVGGSLTLLKSVDGGESWQRRTIRNIPNNNLLSIRCGDAAHCLVTTAGGLQLLRTVDGGDTFTSIVPSTDATHAVAFSNPGRAVAAGVLGSAEVSNDAGATWEAVGSRIAGAFGVMAAVPGNSTAYAGGSQGVLARTRDSGQTWVNVSPPTDAPILALAGAAPDRLYVLAADQSLQRSDNGGQSYRLLNTGTAGPVATLGALDADTLLLVGFRGVVRSSDGGETFAPVQDADVRGKLLNAVDRADGAVVVFSPRVAALSTDHGRRWSRVRLPRRRAVRDLDFATARVGMLLDNRGELWRTGNGGRSWQPLPSLGTGRARSIELADAGNGYAVVNQFGSLVNLGLVLRTSDGGRSWHPQLVGRAVLDSVQSGGPVDYALAGGSTLYATTVRGDVGAMQSLTVSTRRRVLARPARVVVGGRLAPADGGEEIVVARFARGRWSMQTATAASNGSFSTRWRLDVTSVFVAQVLGDADHAGAGTRPLTVTVLPRLKS